MNRSASSNLVTRVSPSLQHPLDPVSDLHITRSRNDARSVAVSFGKSSLLPTQLETPSDNSLAISIRLNELNPTEPDRLSVTDVAQATWNALFFYFGGVEKTARIELPLPSNLVHEALLSLGAVHESPSYTISRSAIFQLFSYAHGKGLPIPFPYIPSTSSANLVHPTRPKKPSSLKPIYSRYIPHLESYYKLDVLTPNNLTIMHKWLNDERVDVFWQEAGTLAVHEEFIKGRVEDKHTVAVIGSYVPISKEGDLKEAEPATYTEIYWVKEDRLGPLYEVQDYDRGLHMLVGSNLHRGPHRIKAWIPSLVHYCFLDDPRTQRVVAEPNALNEKMITYLESVGFVRHGDVTFPHKTAALMICERNHFYELSPF